MHVTQIVVILLFVFVMWCIWFQATTTENLSGYGVTSALAFNNRPSYCWEGNDMYGGALSPGCTTIGRVVF